MTSALPPLVPPPRCRTCDDLLVPVGVVLECPRGCPGTTTAKQHAHDLATRDRKPAVDRDARFSRPTLELCRLFHGICCQIGCGETEAS